MTEPDPTKPGLIYDPTVAKLLLAPHFQWPADWNDRAKECSRRREAGITLMRELGALFNAHGFEATESEHDQVWSLQINVRGSRVSHVFYVRHNGDLCSKYNSPDNPFQDNPLPKTLLYMPIENRWVGLRQQYKHRDDAPFVVRSALEVLVRFVMATLTLQPQPEIEL